VEDGSAGALVAGAAASAQGSSYNAGLYTALACLGCGLAGAAALVWLQRRRRKRHAAQPAKVGRGGGSKGRGGSSLRGGGRGGSRGGGRGGPPTPPRSKPLAHSLQSFAQFYGEGRGSATLRDNPLGSVRAARAARA
jgi:hypothetical protein